MTKLQAEAKDGKLKRQDENNKISSLKAERLMNIPCSLIRKLQSENMIQ